MTKEKEVYSCDVCGNVVEVINEGGGSIICCGLPMTLLREAAGDTIDFSQFEKVDLRVGKVVEAERVEGSDKLIRLQVDLGSEKRQILAGIGKAYAPEELLNKSVTVVVNLAPRTMMGLESKGMVLAVKDGDKLSVLVPEEEILPGSKIS